MTPEQAKKLREPFPPELIGKLPKAGMQLDYVGHAATTDRLLQADPDWTWEPMAYGPNGEPLLTNGGMWIWLTVGGVRRPGFGDGPDPKQIISDAIRNAAMRFGVALDLWSKEDLHAVEASKQKPASRPDLAPSAAQRAAAAKPIKPSLLTLEERLLELVAAYGLDVPAMREKILAQQQRPQFEEWLKRQIAAAESSLKLREEQERADREAQVESPGFVAPTGKRGEKAAA